MGHQIIVQPDGLLSVFSTGVDGFVYTDATDEELIEWYSEQAKFDEAQRTREMIWKVRTKDKPYYQFTMTYEEALTTHIEIYGELTDEEA